MHPGHGKILLAAVDKHAFPLIISVRTISSAGSVLRRSKDEGCLHPSAYVGVSPSSGSGFVLKIKLLMLAHLKLRLPKGSHLFWALLLRSQVGILPVPHPIVIRTYQALSRTLMVGSLD